MSHNLFEESYHFFKVPYIAYIFGGILIVGGSIILFRYGRDISHFRWLINICMLILILSGSMLCNFEKLRTTITDRGIVVQFGIFRKFVPKEIILTCGSYPYDWKYFGGWGIRWTGRKTVAYSVIGLGTHSIKLTYQNKYQQKATLVISTLQEEKICSLLKQLNPSITFENTK